jgi:hypothetical protein
VWFPALIGSVVQQAGVLLLDGLLVEFPDVERVARPSTS